MFRSEFNALKFKSLFRAIGGKNRGLLQRLSTSCLKGACVPGVCLLLLLNTGLLPSVEFSSATIVSFGSDPLVPIHLNEGHLPAEVKFAGIAPTGNSIYFNSDGSVGFGLSAVGDRWPELKSSFRLVNADPSPAFFTVERMNSSTMYLDIPGQTKIPALPNYAALEVHDAYEGVSLSYQCNGRQLLTTYSIAADPGVDELLLEFDNVDAMRLDDETGAIALDILYNGRIRTIDLQPMTVSEPGKEDRRQAFVITPDDKLSFDISGLAEGATLKQALTLSPYFFDYDAVEGAGGIVLVSTALDSRLYGSELSRSDVMITVLNSEKDEILATAILATADAESAAALCIAELGPGQESIYVAGATDSRDFPAAGTPQAMDAFLINIDDKLTSVNSGLLLGAAGDDYADDVTLKSDGSLLVTGRSGGLFGPLNTAGFNFKTLFPALAPNLLMQDYFVAQADEGLTALAHAVEINAPALNERLRIAEADGDICVGVGGSDDGPEAEVCHQMSHNHYSGSNCYCNDNLILNPPWVQGASQPWGRWGYFALRWKDYESGYTYNPGNVQAPGVAGFDIPWPFVNPDDADILNKFENNEAGDIFFLNGTPTDPGGSWYENYASSGPELVVGAAIFMGEWNTPVFTDVLGLNPVAIREICFDDNSPHDICNWQWNTIDIVDATCADDHMGSTFEFLEFKDSKWFHAHAGPNGNPQTGFINEHTQVAASYNWFVEGTYVADPPDGSSHAVRAIAEVARRLHKTVVAKVDLDCTEYVDGIANNTQTVSKLIRMVDFPIVAPEESSVTGAADAGPRSPLPFEFQSVRPNPAQDAAAISFAIHSAGEILLELLDGQGRQVRIMHSGYLDIGVHNVRCSTEDLASGSYYLRISAGGSYVTTPLQIVR